jgi:hypothetical protein
MNSKKSKINNNEYITNKPNKSKTNEECPKENKDCDNCQILYCPEEEV